MAPYDIRIERKGSLAVVHVAGDFRDKGQMFGEVGRRSRQLLADGVDRVLLLREPGRYAPPLALMELLLSLPDLGSERLCVAIVHPDYGADLEFYNNNAAMRGIASRLFADRESAERWLDRTESSAPP